MGLPILALLPLKGGYKLIHTIKVTRSPPLAYYSLHTIIPGPGTIALAAIRGFLGHSVGRAANNRG